MSAVLSTLRPKAGSKKKMKRLGRGDGSGHGGTSTKGHKGQKARSSPDVSRGFEGGQMPLQRRSPKWGFTNPSQVIYAPINLDSLTTHFKAGEEVTPETLRAKGLIRGKDTRVKILGRGRLGHALKISAHAISSTAQKAIEASQGTFSQIGKSKS